MGSKIVTVASNAKLKAEQDKMLKLQAFDSNYFPGKSHFQDFLVF